MKKEIESSTEKSESIEVIKDYGSSGRIVKIDLSSNGLLEVLGGSSAAKD